MSNSTVKLPLMALLCALAAVALSACGGGGETSSSTTVASHPDVDRFCELVNQLDENSAAIFDALSADGIPTDEQLAAAQLQVLNENADLIDELTAVTPAEIRDDFELSLESARQRAEAGDSSQPSKEVAQANVRLLKFRRQNCPKPSAP
jgi:hypothetical protein